MKTIELTDDQCELISKMLDMLDRTYECLSISEALSREHIDKDWERRMLEASQELAEEFPSTGFEEGERLRMPK
jgi:hypothetical protein